MLSRDQALSTIDFSQREVRPDRLTRQAHAEYPDHAAKMIDVYRHGAGQTRQQLHRQVDDILSGQLDCPSRRIAAFCKLLDQFSVFDQGTSGEAARLRQSVFRLAATHHPLVSRPNTVFGSERSSVRKRIAEELDRPWESIEDELFADVIENHRLKRFSDELSAGSLLSVYNVAQTQVALFDATDLTVWAASDLKAIVRATKLAGLMHWIVRQDDGVYCFRLSGPASVTRETRRYGTAMARFLPNLIACHDWRLHASLRLRKQRGMFNLRLNSSDGLTSRAETDEEFDSSVEQRLSETWGADSRDGWALEREAELLFDRQHVCVPDFTLRHETGFRVPVEVVGFWSPEYLSRKQSTLQRFPDQPIILAIRESTGPSMDISSTSTMSVVRYKSSVRIGPLVRAAESLRRRDSARRLAANRSAESDRPLRREAT